MKRILGLILMAVLLFTSSPISAAEPYEAEVSFVGQWVGESSSKKDTIKTFTSPDDKLGEPEWNAGLLRGLAKQFLGWSDKAPVNNGELAEGARLYSPADKISDVFPNGIPQDAKIYGVYYSVNSPPEAPFPQSAFDLIALSGMVQNLEEKVNDNKVMINVGVSGEDILKNTEIKTEKTENNLRKITDYYQAGDNKEVVLKSQFKMDDTVNMLAYRNKTGSNLLRPILSYDYNTRFKNSDFPIFDGPDAGYTYVDLNMNFAKDQGLVLPEKMFLEFKSYAWRPLYAFGIDDNGNKELLNIYGLDGADNGKDTNSFINLVSQNPSTKFGVQTKVGDKQYREITIRVILREWDNNLQNPSRNPFSGERIPESSITPLPGKTIAETILSNMELNVLGSADGIKAENLVKITDEKAKSLADGEGQDTIDITGSIQGHVIASAGSISAFGMTMPLRSEAAINKKLAEEGLALTYVYKPEEPKKEIFTYFIDENGNNLAPSQKGTVDKIFIDGYEYVNTTTDKDGNTYHHYKKLEDNIYRVKPYIVETSPQEETHMAYIKGYEDSSLRANGNLTRAEAAAMVTRLAKLDLNDKSKPAYSDLEDDAWYLSYINAALKAEMLDAEDGKLRPDDKITRGEFAKMLAAIDRDNDHVSKFEDIAGHKYEKEIHKIAGNGRIDGYGDGSFRPDNLLTRAEAAAFLNRMFNRVADDKAIEGFENSLIKFTDLDKSDWFYYEIVEATNSHVLIRREGSDKFKRDYEDWKEILPANIK